MADSSTCLVRSFSTPVETNENNPLRALGESISFGRYMTETLEWEKWSTFTQKRYVEEAERYSKPGSVAAKRAYFEAHYKRKAAEKASVLIQEENVKADETFYSENLEGSCSDSSIQMKSEEDNIEAHYKRKAAEKAAVLIEEENVKADQTFDSENLEGSCSDSSIQMKSEEDNIEAHYKRKAAEKAAVLIEEENVKADQTFDSENLEGSCSDSSIQMKSEEDSVEVVNEQMDEDIVDCQVVDCDATNQYKCDVGLSELDVSEVEGEKDVLHSSIQMNSEEDNVGVLNEHMNEDIVDCQVVDCDATNQYKCDVGLSELDVSEVEGEKDVPHSCDVTDLNVLSCVHVDNSNQLDHVEDQNIVIPMEETVPDLDIVGQEILALPVEEREVNSSPKSSAKTGATKLSRSRDEKKANAAVPPRNGLNSGVKAKKYIGDAVEKKRLAALSTSKMSIGCLVEKKRLTASLLHMSINVPSGTGVASKSTATAVKPSNRINIAPKSMKSVGATMEKKPTARSLHMSISLPSGAGPTAKKISCNLPKDHPVLKTSTITKIIPQAPTIASPFRFRSEERAIRRKELMQKREETTSKEEKKAQLQRISKGTTELDHKKLPKSKLNEDRQSGSHSPRNKIRKISLTMPQSPKPVTKASCNTIRDKNLGNSQKPPISTNNSKHITEKINRTRHSGISLSNTRRENASPNIQN